LEKPGAHMPIDTARIARLREALRQAGLDGLAVRLPEHVLQFSGYWPMNAQSLLLLNADGIGTLLAPAGEASWAMAHWWGVHTFRGGALTDPAPLFSMGALLRGGAGELGRVGGGIGWEASCERVAPAYVAAELPVPAARTAAMLHAATGG